MDIAIFGAAGSIGTAVAPEFLKRGHKVRAVGRHVDRLRAACPGCEPFAADLDAPNEARAAAAGMDAVLYAVGFPYPDYAHYPPQMRVVVDACVAANVRELLAINTVYPYGVPQTERVAETHPLAACTRKGLARKEQLEITLRAHRPDGLHTAVLVLPDFYGPGLQNTYLTSVFEGAASGKTAFVIGPIDTKHEFVFVPDAAVAIAELFAHPEAFNGTHYNLGGAGTVVPRAMYEQAYRMAAAQPRLLVVGPALQRFLGVFNPLLREAVEMNYLWTTPVILDDAKLSRVIGPPRKTSYPDGVRAGVRAAQMALSQAAMLRA